ncbi:MAG TPA: hypothetical protein VFY36_05455 [Solirubrobacteraceae bacterium]|nr:hypothetical protein [Solirubrobacteraceae bacterium]
MSENERIRELREKIDALDRGIYRTFERLCRKERECVALKEANADLLAQQDGADVLLGAAIDEALRARQL